MPKFVGSLRDLKHEFKSRVKAIQETWVNRRELIYYAGGELQREAVWGLEIWDEDGHIIGSKPGRQLSDVGLWLAARLEWLGGLFQPLVYGWYCWAFDHDIVDDSYGTPDSGCMAGHCKRCGWSYHTWLY